MLSNSLVDPISMIKSFLKPTRKLIILLVYLLSVLLLSACQTTSSKDFNPVPLLHDSLFPSYQKVIIESETEVFDIGKNAAAFVDKHLSRVEGSDQRIKALADSIFLHSALNLLYKNDANTIASETFENKAANCLSLIIMTYGMADHANIGVKFQQVDIPELWVRREGDSLLNRHVNLKLYQKNEQNLFLFNSRTYQLDFDRRAQSLNLPGNKISKTRVLALFYNNKGADALIKEHYTQAYAYFRSALLKDHFLVEAWANLGVLYRRAGRIDYAESSYLKALQIKSNDITTLENLAYIYTITLRTEEAERLNAIVLNHRKENPFYHSMLGDVQYENENWLEAIKHYKKSIRLDKKQNEFYFSLAKSYFQLGDINNSEKYLKLAKKYSYDDGQQLFYQSKLDAFTKLRPE